MPPAARPRPRSFSRRRLAASAALFLLVAATLGCAKRQRYVAGELPPPRPRRVRVAEAAQRPEEPKVFAEYEERLLVHLPWPGASAEQVDAQLRGPFEKSALAVVGVTACYARGVDGALVARLELEPRADSAKTGDAVAKSFERDRKALPPTVGKPTIRPIRERRPGFAAAE